MTFTHYKRSQTERFSFFQSDTISRIGEISTKDSKTTEATENQWLLTYCGACETRTRHLLTASQTL